MAQRYQQIAATRDRIIEAAAQGLTRGTLDLGDVARRARVSERTVYRHFPTHRALQEAVIAFFERRAGGDREQVTADSLVDLPRRLFPMMRDVSFAPPQREPGALVEERARRHARIRDAVRALMPRASRVTVDQVAALFQILLSVDALAGMRKDWQLDADAAGEASSWALGVLVAQLRHHKANWPTRRRRKR